MELPEVWRKYHETDSMDMFFKALRMAISKEATPRTQLEMAALYKKMWDLYNEAKMYPSDKDKINMEMGPHLLRAERYVQAIIDIIKGEKATYT